MAPALAGSVDPAHRPFFSVCIPAYNRAEHLPALLESILAEPEFSDFEVVIAEDCSPERDRIRKLVEGYQPRSPVEIRLVMNPENLGFDANVRGLVELARGRFCFFMGNDDVMAPRALERAAGCLSRHPEAGFLLRSYGWFVDSPDQLCDTVRYSTEELLLPPGKAALSMCYRRAGILAGFVIERDAAAEVATDRFDGTLFYQMHLAASVLQHRAAVVTPEVLIYCHSSDQPEFGAAAVEKGTFKPGRYTPEARHAMVAGALRILHSQLQQVGMETYRAVTLDYARHFYPHVRDQLSLSPVEYFRLCRAYAQLDIGRYPSFYLNCIIAYLLGQKLSDRLIRTVRRSLGHTPRLSTTDESLGRLPSPLSKR